MNRRRLLLSLGPALLAQAWLPSASGAKAPRMSATSAVPGGVAKIRLGASEQPPQVRVRGERVLLLREGTDWIAFVGIALAAKPGSKVQVQAEHAGGRQERLEIKVVPKKYASQYLKVSPDKVDLSKEDLERYERERAHLGGVLKTFTDTPPISTRRSPKSICSCSPGGVSNRTVARAAAINSRRSGATARSTVRRLITIFFSRASSWRTTSALPAC